MLYSFCLELLRNTQIVQQLNLTSLIAKPFVFNTLFPPYQFFGETETRWAGTSSSRMTASFTIALTCILSTPFATTRTPRTFGFSVRKTTGVSLSLHV